MTEGLVLHPPADLVEAAVGDPHDVERVGHPAGVIQPGRQAGAEASARSVATTLIPASHAGIGVGDPSAQVSGAVAFDHVDDARGVAGRPARWRRRWRGPGWRPGTTSRRSPAGAPDRPGRGSSTSGVPCSITGVHDRPPAHPELLGHLRHRAGQLTDLAARLGPGPAGQHHLGVELLGASRSTSCASHNGSRHRHRRLRHTSRAGRPKHGQIPDRDPHPILGLRPSPAPRAADHLGVVSIVTTSSTAVSRHLEHPEAGQSQQRLGQTVTVAHAGVSSSSLPSDSRDDGGTPAPHGGPRRPTPARPPPYSDAKSLIRSLASAQSRYRSQARPVLPEHDMHVYV